ncbi:MAG: hypothetical protein AB7K09_09560 [Planctomycetota bacterium]
MPDSIVIALLALVVLTGIAWWVVRNSRVEPPPLPTSPPARVLPVDPDERAAAVPLETLFPPFSYRWAAFDRPTRTVWFGGPGVKTHMTVAEMAGLLSQHPDYYSPGPRAQMCGGFVARGSDGCFYYDPFSGTFPGTRRAIEEASAALREVCAAQGLPWKPYDPTRREFD